MHAAATDAPQSPTTEQERTESAPTPAPVTSTSDSYDERDFSSFTNVESEPPRADTLFPMQLPPLPTRRSLPEHLDIAHGGSGRGENSGEGGSSSDDGSSSGAEGGPSVTPVQVWLGTTTMPLPNREMDPQHPAVVFKEDVTPGAPSDVNQSLAIPADGESTGKPPFHVIIVNVHSQNQSGELYDGKHLTFDLH